LTNSNSSDLVEEGQRKDAETSRTEKFCHTVIREIKKSRLKNDMLTYQERHED